MSISVNGRPYPFPGLEDVRRCRVVGGSNLTRGTVVALVTGKNSHSSAVDGVAPGAFFPSNWVVAATNVNYPTTGHSGIVNGAAVPAALGYLNEDTDDDGWGEVIFRGYVADDVDAITSAALISAGEHVFLDQSNSYALSCSPAVAPAAADIIVGKVATATTPAGTTGPIDILWDGISTRYPQV